MPLTARELAGLRRQLLAKGEELAAMLVDLLAGKRPSALDLLVAKPGETEEERLRRFLGLIQARLDAMAAGRYGRCEACGVELPAAALAEVPWQDLCPRCALVMAA